MARFCLERQGQADRLPQWQRRGSQRLVARMTRSLRTRRGCQAFDSRADHSTTEEQIGSQPREGSARAVRLAAIGATRKIQRQDRELKWRRPRDSFRQHLFEHSTNSRWILRWHKVSNAVDHYELDICFARLEKRECPFCDFKRNVTVVSPPDQGHRT